MKQQDLYQCQSCEALILGSELRESRICKPCSTRFQLGVITNLTKRTEGCPDCQSPGVVDSKSGCHRCIGGTCKLVGLALIDRPLHTFTR
jgi:hypothetical protein